MQKNYTAQYEARKVVEGSDEFKALESLLESFDGVESNLDDPFIYVELEAKDEVVEDDGNVHVTRGHVRVGDSLGQERKILKRDEKAVAAKVDEWLANDRVAAAVEAVNKVVADVNSRLATYDVNALTEAIDDAEAEVDAAEAKKAEAEQALRAYFVNAKPVAAMNYDELKDHCAKKYNMVGHPKLDAVFTKAWDEGHSEGCEQVEQEFIDLAELVK